MQGFSQSRFSQSFIVNLVASCLWRILTFKFNGAPPRAPCGLRFVTPMIIGLLKSQLDTKLTMLYDLRADFLRNFGRRTSFAGQLPLIHLLLFALRRVLLRTNTCTTRRVYNDTLFHYCPHFDLNVQILTHLDIYVHTHSLSLLCTHKQSTYTHTNTYKLTHLLVRTHCQKAPTHGHA